MSSSVWKNEAICLGWVRAPDFYCPPEGIVDFVGVPLRGYAPLTVQFTDLSTGSPTSWDWDVEGGTYTIQNPQHIYTSPGLYTVSLSAYNEVDSSGPLLIGTEIKVDYIEVLALPTVLSVANDTVIEGETLEFLVTLSEELIAPVTFSISWGGGTLSPSEHATIPLFTAGVTWATNYTHISVPAGVETFLVRFTTSDDAVIESTETLPITIGGVSATGYVEDNESALYCPVDSYQALNLDPVSVTGFTFEGTASISNLGDRKWYVDGPIVAVYSDQFKYIRYHVQDPSVKKFDTLRFWSTGNLEVIVTDENNVSHTTTINRPIVSDSDLDPFEPYFMRYTFRLLRHPPFGTSGNIKTVQINYNTATSFNGMVLDALELFCSNPETTSTVVDKIQYVNQTFPFAVMLADYNQGTGLLSNKTPAP